MSAARHPVARWTEACSALMARAGLSPAAHALVQAHLPGWHGAAPLTGDAASLASSSPPNRAAAPGAGHHAQLQGARA